MLSLAVAITITLNISKEKQMGKLTECFDYLAREPKTLTNDFISFNYTHINIGPEEKKLRRELKLYKK